MQIDRSKNSIRNIASGVLSQIVSLILPFVIHTIIIKQLGAEYSGLNGLYSSILQVLSLTELGFATAMVFSMYKPIAEDNTELVCALLKLYRTVYYVIGTVIVLIGVGLMPFFDYIIHGTTPTDVNIYLLYLIYLFNTSISYFFFAYKASILTATVRSDVSTNITTITCLLQYGAQILTLCLLHNYYAYIIITPICTMIANFLRSRAVDKLYPQYKPRGRVGHKVLEGIERNIKGLFFHRIGSVVINSTDNIVISAFFASSLIEVTRYGNYYYIMSAVSGFLIVIYNAISASVGNAVATKTKEENYRDFMKFTSLNLWIVGWCAVCLFSLYQHFMAMWMFDLRYESMVTIFLFALYFYVYRARAITTSYKSAAGIYWEDRWCPVISACSNIILDVVYVRFFGINGIILATITSMLLIETPWELTMLFKLYFKRKPTEYLLYQGVYLLSSVLFAGITYFVCSLLPFPTHPSPEFMDFVWLFVKGLICLVLPNVGYFALSKVMPHGREALFFVRRNIIGRLLKK